MPDTILTDTSVPSLKQIVERYLPDVTWKDDLTGVCQCPGHSKHTHRSTKRDCKVYLSGTPTVYCLHQSCEKEVSEANSQIRTAWALFQPEIPAADLAAAKQKAARRYELEERARASLPEILKQYAWPVKEIDQNLPTGREAYELFMQTVWSPNDIVWRGEPDDSGQEKHAGHFKAAHDFSGPIGNFTCPSTFKPGTYSRSTANVVSTPYLVIEGDEVIGKKPETDYEKQSNKDQSGAVYRWLIDRVGVRPRAIIDSGGRSLHFWIFSAGAVQLEELRTILPVIGFDRAMFKVTQPCRLPGRTRDNGNEQKLLWLN